METEVAVLGSGPGGYTAAFRAADLGKKVVLIERYATLGGVCLNVGCIPSKALLHTAKVMKEAKEAAHCGVVYSEPTVELSKLRDWKNGVIGQLTQGLSGLAKMRNVEVVQGIAQIVDPHHIKVDSSKGSQTITFEHLIIAAGSQPISLPFLPEDPRIIDSTGALALEDIPETMLVIGGGIIGLEMATVYSALGAKVSIVELTDGLMPGTDRDLVKGFNAHAGQNFENIYLSSKVTKVEAMQDGLWVTFDGVNAPSEPVKFDKILASVGRTPNGKKIGAENAGIQVDDRGFIPVDQQMRTNIPHIFAIGDIVGNPMLAHKAIPQGKIAAEVISGKNHYFDPKVIPSVAYTDPEVAWVGLTETEAKSQKIQYKAGVFPWMASGRSLSMQRKEGLTKLLFDEQSRVLGGGIVGPNAGELIAEITLAIEMGCVAEDLALTIHPHPTLSETVGLATEMFEGTITDLMPKSR